MYMYIAYIVLKRKKYAMHMAPYNYIDFLYFLGEVYSILGVIGTPPHCTDRCHIQIMTLLAPNYDINMN